MPCGGQRGALRLRIRLGGAVLRRRFRLPAVGAAVRAPAVGSVRAVVVGVGVVGLAGVVQGAVEFGLVEAGLVDAAPAGFTPGRRGRAYNERP